MITDEIQMITDTRISYPFELRLGVVTFLAFWPLRSLYI